MIVKINSRGTSFGGIGAYLMTGERDKPDPDRVLFTATSDNLCGVNIDTAAKMMAYTDMSRDDSGPGRKATQGPVYHFSLSWAHDEKPDPQHQEQTGRAAIDRLGLSDHEYFIVGHKDRDHSHIHVVVNLTHPETGKRASPSYQKRRLSDFARDYEREHGIKCEAREKNAASFEKGQTTKHQDRKQSYAQEVTAAYKAADNGRAFVHALKDQGLELGRARRGSGFVIVDGQGNIQSLSRQLDIEEKGGAKSKAINTKLADLQKNDVRDGDEIAARIKNSLGRASREDHDSASYNKILAGADAHAKKVAAQERKAEFRKQKEAERQADRESRYAKNLDRMERRHDWQRIELEGELERTVGGHLNEIKLKAERLQHTIEGRGFGKSLRRLWRGRQDRQDLSEMRDRINQLETAMNHARSRVKEIQSREKAQLKSDHEQARYNFRKEDPEKQIETLQRMNEKRREEIKKDGQDRAAIHANDPKQRAINNRIWQIREDQKKKEAENKAERDSAAQYPASVKRAQEVEQQKDPESSKANRVRQKAEEIRARIDQSKDRDFER